MVIRPVKNILQEGGHKPGKTWSTPGILCTWKTHGILREFCATSEKL